MEKKMDNEMEIGGIQGAKELNSSYCAGETTLVIMYIYIYTYIYA